MLAVILPCRNGAHLIEKTIESVIDQDYFIDHSFRIYVIDNGSTDNLKYVTSKYSKVICLRCDEIGVAPALNYGVFQTLLDNRIDLIARIDAGDLWYKDKLSKQIKFMQDNSLDVCGTQMKFWGERNFDSQYPIYHEQFYVWLANGHNPIGHPSVIYKKNIFTYTGGYNENYKGAEDFDLWCKCFHRFKMGNVPDVLVEYHLETKDRSVGDNNAQIAAANFRNLNVRISHN